MRRPDGISRDTSVHGSGGKLRRVQALYFEDAEKHLIRVSEPAKVIAFLDSAGFTACFCRVCAYAPRGGAPKACEGTGCRCCLSTVTCGRRRPICSPWPYEYQILVGRNDQAMLRKAVNSLGLPDHASANPSDDLACCRKLAQPRDAIACLREEYFEFWRKIIFHALGRRVNVEAVCQ
jgi:hypothetical protein